MSQQEDFFEPVDPEQDPFAENPSDPEDPTSGEPELQRHGCLTAFLVVIVIANIGTLVANIVLQDQISDSLPDMPDWGTWFLTFMAVVNVACAILVWQWKRVGVVGFFVSAVITLAFNLSMVGAGVSTFSGLIGPIILAALISKSWKHMKWI